jgi:hypothetical protein
MAQGFGIAVLLGMAVDYFLFQGAYTAAAHQLVSQILAHF